MDSDVSRDGVELKLVQARGDAGGVHHLHLAHQGDQASLSLDPSVLGSERFDRCKFLRNLRIQGGHVGGEGIGHGAGIAVEQTAVLPNLQGGLETFGFVESQGDGRASIGVTHVDYRKALRSGCVGIDGEERVVSRGEHEGLGVEHDIPGEVEISGTQESGAQLQDPFGAQAEVHFAARVCGAFHHPAKGVDGDQRIEVEGGTVESDAPGGIIQKVAGGFEAEGQVGTRHAGGGERDAAVSAREEDLVQCGVPREPELTGGDVQDAGVDEILGASGGEGVGEQIAVLVDADQSRGVGGQGIEVEGGGGES